MHVAVIAIIFAFLGSWFKKLCASVNCPTLRRRQITQEFGPLCHQLSRQEIDAGHVAARPGQTGDKTKPDGVCGDDTAKTRRTGRKPRKYRLEQGAGTGVTSKANLDAGWSLGCWRECSQQRTTEAAERLILNPQQPPAACRRTVSLAGNLAIEVRHYDAPERDHGRMSDADNSGSTDRGGPRLDTTRCDPKVKPHGKRPRGAQPWHRKQTIPRSANIMRACEMRGSRWRKDVSSSTFLM
jgi:hypothetical protein